MKEVQGINSKQADHLTIDVLEGLLEKAKSGELRSILFIDKYRDGKIGNGWAGAPDKEMIGEMEALKFLYFTQLYLPEES